MNHLQEPYDAKCGDNHIVQEFLQHVPRQGLDGLITSSLDKRFRLAKAKPSGRADKSVNHVSALPGTPGSGKSTELVHYPESRAYRAYVEDRRACTVELLKVSHQEPIVSILTFNGVMEGGPQSLGLRIIFGMLRSMGMISSTSDIYNWTAFHKHFHESAEMDGMQAVTVIRAAFGEDRLIFIGVDEIGMCPQDQKIMRDLGAILTIDGNTDVLITALTPAYVDNLVTGSRRRIDYIIMPALMAAVQEYASQAQTMLLQAKKHGKVDDIAERIILAAPLLASGHPRTIEFLVLAARDGSFWDNIKEAVTLKNAYVLLCNIARVDVFTAYCSPPTTEKERNLLLSMRKRSARKDKLFRVMLEESSCFVHRALGLNSFSATTGLSSFLLRLEDLKLKKAGRLGPLSAAARTLFADVSQIGELWERCCALSVVARTQLLQDMLGGTAAVSVIFSVDDFNTDSYIANKLQVHMAQAGDAMQRSTSTLVVGPPKQPGWDFMLCSEDTNNCQCFTYIEVKVDVPAKDLASVKGDKIRLILADHFQRLGSNIAAKEDDEFRKVAIIFSIFPAATEAQAARQSARSDVLSHLNRRLQEAIVAGSRESANLASLQRAIRYVERHFDGNVRTMGRDQMESAIIPVLLPVARLVQAVNGAGA